MTRKIEEVSEIKELNFVNEKEKEEVIGAIIVLSEGAVKSPIVKIFETKNIKQLRLYVYDSFSWKYNLFLTYDLVK